jgi:exonuclease SbcC
MPSLPRNHQPSADSLRTYLESVLPYSQVTNAIVDPAYQPLLLLHTAHTMVAFAFANGDMRTSYDALYGSFKNYYVDQHGQWDDLDLAFVFCVEPDMPDLDHFCSKVETNVYFCRKFVVSLAQPLGISLARLPFLPLMPLDGGSLRPPSAQTFLQKCGVPAALARYLVVQHERGPERIIEDCLSGEFSEPTNLLPSSNAQIQQSDAAMDHVSLDKVKIQNFRAYRRPQSFTIGADVTVLYGPNGFGKTSFFDAIDFAVTGGIGRLTSSNDVGFAKTAQHLDCGSEESIVSLSFTRNDATRMLTRSVRDRKQPLLDGVRTDRKTVLSELTGSPPTERVDNSISLFRATHLFSQEQQELMRDFQNDCRLSEEIVSRMLAVEDYANAVNKTARILEIVQSAIANAIREIKDLSRKIADEQTELDRLGQVAKAHANVEALDAEIEAIRRRMATVGIGATQQKPDIAILRGWRAALEARRAENQSRITRLSMLTKEVAGLPRARAEIAKLQELLRQREDAIGKAEDKRVPAELAFQQAEQRLAEINSKCGEAQAKANLLEQIRAAKPLYEQRINEQRTLNKELSHATEALAQHREVEEKTTSDLRAQEHLAAQCMEKLQTKRSDLMAVQTLKDSVAPWQANQLHLVAVIESEQAAAMSLQSLRTEEQELAPHLTSMIAEEGRMSRQIEEVDKSQSELKRLLSQFQGHVHTGTCPLCGQDHKSKDKLLRRIQQHTLIDAASGARTDLTGVKERITRLAEQVAANKEKQVATNIRLANLKTERSRLQDEIARFESSSASLGIVIEMTDPTPTEQLHARQTLILQEINELNRQIPEIRVAAEAVRKSLTTTKNLVTTNTEDITAKKSVLARLQAEATNLREPLRMAALSLDSPDEQLADIEQLNISLLTGLQTEISTIQAEVEQKKSTVLALRQESASIKAELPALRNQLANLQRTMTQILARVGESKLPADSSEEMLLGLIGEESRIQAELLALRDSTSNLELAIDAATTAAALTNLLEGIRIKEMAVATAIQQRDKHEPWLMYFQEVSRLVSSEKNEAIANFTREYGPRASVIQRRLRSVYGFDEIEIRSDESTISVRVKRHGEELRPKDYFSQSQQQTLLLGLFLTACISQTWSAFSPVLLDDPVTHFDNLNTYAFLDLIVGLIESDSWKRQFIISTCDEKLLQLARQKFRHLGERAKFHQFEAIGAYGPIVAEISSPSSGHT